MVFQVRKVRKLFPKKGIERKALKFSSNIGRMPVNKRSVIIKRFLKSKVGYNRKVALNVLKGYKSREKLFSYFNDLVKEFRVKNPSFEGVILFGGMTKKITSPTDLDFIFVGNLSSSEKRRFCDSLVKATGIPANPFPVKIDVINNPKVFESLLSVPYLSGPEEWAVQNFVGPLKIKRLLMKSYKSALKKTNVYREKNLS